MDVPSRVNTHSRGSPKRHAPCNPVGGDGVALADVVASLGDHLVVPVGGDPQHVAGVHANPDLLGAGVVGCTRSTHRVGLESWQRSGLARRALTVPQKELFPPTPKNMENAKVMLVDPGLGASAVGAEDRLAVDA